jgi:hypothetical protein
MKHRTWNTTAARTRNASLTLTLFCMVGVQLHAAPQPQQPREAAAQKGFNNPDEAAKALVDAAEKYDVPALLSILGPDAKDLVASEDQTAERNRAAAFARMAREKISVTTDARKTRAEVTVGTDAWPLPIPLVNRNGKWYFDTKAGRHAILLRRIGENELSVIQICRGFVEAEHEYAATKHDGSELNQYAQRIISTPGKQDGLAWQNADGTWGGPIGEGAAKAVENGYSAGKPYHGYFFKVLKGQGPAAPLGQLNFVVNGAMIGGFALVATPAQYRVTGVKTFMVGYDGIVYEKDLGPSGLEVFKQMELYNPDKTWRPTNDGL